MKAHLVQLHRLRQHLLREWGVACTSRGEGRFAGARQVSKELSGLAAAALIHLGPCHSATQAGSALLEVM